jgi:ArsR family transcriptional regulator, arsenate/arsenite/antimonite-responsive transcriptional repressor
MTSHPIAGTVHAGRATCSWPTTTSRCRATVRRDTVVLALGALAQNVRFEMVSLLAANGSEGLPAGVIATRLGVPPASLSFHFQQLVRAGLVTQRRQSRFVIYAANGRMIDCLLAYLDGHCRCRHLKVG